MSECPWPRSAGKRMVSPTLADDAQAFHPMVTSDRSRYVEGRSGSPSGKENTLSIEVRSDVDVLDRSRRSPPLGRDGKHCRCLPKPQTSAGHNRWGQQSRTDAHNPPRVLHTTHAHFAGFTCATLLNWLDDFCSRPRVVPLPRRPCDLGRTLSASLRSLVAGPSNRISWRR